MTDDTSPVEDEPVYEPADDDVGEDDPKVAAEPPVED